MEHFTKWCEAFPAKDQKAATVISLSYQECFPVLDPLLHSDQGRNFVSVMMHQIYDQIGIKTTCTTA